MLPFIAEYAKSNRARCKRCNESILKDVLRVGVMVQALNFDGKIPQWYHESCFFKRSELAVNEYKPAPRSEWEISRFQHLRYEDQIRLRDRIATAYDVDPLKISSSEAFDSDPLEISSSEEDTDEPDNKQNNIDACVATTNLSCLKCYKNIIMNDMYVKKTENEREEIFHFDCFHALSDAKQRVDNKEKDVEHLPGCSWMKEPQEKVLQNVIYVLDDDDVPQKKMRFEMCNDAKAGNNKLEEQKIAEQQAAFYHLRDGLKKMNVNQLDLTQILIHNDQPVPRGIDSILDRVCDIMMFGALERCSNCGWHFEFQDTGYVCTGNVTRWSKCLQQTTSPLRRKTNISYDLKQRYTIFQEYACAVRDRRIRRIAKAPYGTALPLTAGHSSPIKEADPFGSTSTSKTLPSKIKVHTKNGLTVDPDSELANEAHVYRKGNIIYNCVLNLVDIQQDRNSYYKIQILKADHKRRYWLFRGWGRIGTTIGGTKIQTFVKVDDAIKEFRKLFLEKTRNQWQRHDSQYVKHAGVFYHIELDYSQKNLNSLAKNNTIRSKLDPAVQELIRMIFNVEEMNRVMLEFELDIDKMPLGKLSSRQLQSGMVVLSEIVRLIANQASQAHFIDASNRFYALVPHNFGLAPVKVINTVTQVKEKQTMLETLAQIEFTYSLLNVGGLENGKHLLDVQYAQLKTDIAPLKRSSDEFALIQQYVRNTHAATHKDYALEIDEIFRINRKGEDVRYRPFRVLHNRKLLWHGTRSTNFASILTNGLKIAPPEAPATGYMFGKGLYFADMVSKSANYCCTNPADPKGLMLLCEVALGDMQEYTQAHYVEKLPTGKQSVKGIGRTQPDPNGSYARPDGVEIPLGKGVAQENSNSSLLYNEFIVYNVAQVKCQYLLKMQFQYT